MAKRSPYKRVYLGKRNFAPGDLSIRSIGYTVEQKAGMGGVVSVHVGENTPAGSKNYANAMEFNYYNLGPGSRAKQARGAVGVGRLYIGRAISENTSKISNFISQAVFAAYAKQGLT